MLAWQNLGGECMAQSQNEERKAAMNAMRKFQWGIISGMENALIAKVIDYNTKDHTADILPLANSSDGETSAQYLDIPVTENCYMLDEMIERLKPEFKRIDSEIGYGNGSFVGCFRLNFIG